MEAATVKLIATTVIQVLPVVVDGVIRVHKAICRKKDAARGVPTAPRDTVHDHGAADSANRQDKAIKSNESTTDLSCESPAAERCSGAVPDPESRTPRAGASHTTSGHQNGRPPRRSRKSRK